MKPNIFTSQIYNTTKTKHSTKLYIDMDIYTLHINYLCVCRLEASSKFLPYSNRCIYKHIYETRYIYCTQLCMCKNQSQNIFAQIVGIARFQALLHAGEREEKTTKDKTKFILVYITYIYILHGHIIYIDLLQPPQTLLPPDTPPARPTTPRV